MPGTIQISVLDIIDLPSPSPPPTSSMSIKVIMGKREYQTVGREDLSIPLRTLRENLMVKVIDDAGNEISHAGVETRSIIEKGLWEDLFPLEGGGKMRLKMQFILSEEEKSRIRMMRLSALKKKHGELVTNSPGSPERPAADERNATTSLFHHATSGSSSIKEASDNRIFGSKRAKLHDDAKSEANKVTHPSKKLIIPNHPDGNENTSAASPPNVDVSTAEDGATKILEKTEAQSLPKDINRGDSNGEKPSSFPSNPLTAAAETSPVFSKMEMRGRLEKTPSNVRKMISVFETSDLAQDMKPHIKPPPVKSKSSKGGVPPEAGENKTDVTSGQNVISSPLIHHATGSATMSARVKIAGSFRTEEPACVSGRTPNESSGGDKFRDVFTRKQESSSNSSIDAVKGSHGEDLLKFEIPSAHVRKLLGYGENEQYSGPTEELASVSGRTPNGRKLSGYSQERSAGWIFLDEPQNVCATTCREQVMHMMEHGSSETSVSDENILSKQDNTGKHTRARKPEEMLRREEKGSYKQRNSTVNSSTDADPYGGPIGQVMKLTIMVGFGALVFFTRQRKDR